MWKTLVWYLPFRGLSSAIFSRSCQMNEYLKRLSDKSWKLSLDTFWVSSNVYSDATKEKRCSKQFLIFVVSFSSRRLCNNFSSDGFTTNSSSSNESCETCKRHVGSILCNWLVIAHHLQPRRKIKSDWYGQMSRVTRKKRMFYVWLNIKLQPQSFTEHCLKEAHSCNQKTEKHNQTHVTLFLKRFGVFYF